MSRIDLSQLAQRESEQVEWKLEVADWQDAVRTLVAFANDLPNLGGGYLVCGAKEERDEHGFPRIARPGLTAARIAELRGKVVHALRDFTEPALAPIVDELDGDTPDRRVVVFTMPRTGQAHAWRAKDTDPSGSCWVRVDSQTVLARNGLLRQLLTQRGALAPWDVRIAAGASVDAIDRLALREALVQMDLYRESSGIDPYLEPDRRIATLVPELCAREPLGAVRPRHFAVLLFGREPQRYAPGAYVVLSRYPGVDRSEQTAVRQEITGTLLQQASALLRELDLLTPDVFDKGGPRENLSLFPRRALREAAVNALVHRDYELREPVRITAFRDRIELRSPGGLPLGLDPEAFRQGKASPVWRNQSLAWFFNRLDLAQSEGQGVPTILRVARESGYRAPDFVVDAHAVTVVLYAHPVADQKAELAAVEDALLRGQADAFTKKLERALGAGTLDADTGWVLLLDGLETFVDHAPLTALLLAQRDQLLARPPQLAVLTRLIRCCSRQLAGSHPDFEDLGIGRPQMALLRRLRGELIRLGLDHAARAPLPAAEAGRLAAALWDADARDEVRRVLDAADTDTERSADWLLMDAVERATACKDYAATWERSQSERVAAQARAATDAAWTAARQSAARLSALRGDRHAARAALEALVPGFDFGLDP